MFVIINDKLKLIRQNPNIFLCSFRALGWISPFFIQALFSKSVYFAYHQLICCPVCTLVLCKGQYVLKLRHMVCLPSYHLSVLPKVYSAS